MQRQGFKILTGLGRRLSLSIEELISDCHKLPLKTTEDTQKEGD